MNDTTAAFKAAEALEQNAVALGALVQERDRLLRGEYICKRCGLRKDSERVDEVLFYAE